MKVNFDWKKQKPGGAYQMSVLWGEVEGLSLHQPGREFSKEALRDLGLVDLGN